MFRHFFQFAGSAAREVRCRPGTGTGTGDLQDVSMLPDLRFWLVSQTAEPQSLTKNGTAQIIPASNISKTHYFHLVP